MNKNSFQKRFDIVTLGILLSRVLGIIYVIPLYVIIGEQGGALYGYAYGIYSIFLSFTQIGIPYAISKMVSEYNILGYYHAKKRMMTLSKKNLFWLGIINFLILFFSARWIAILIIGNISGGNTIKDITFVIRVISFAMLVTPILNFYRGYLQGQKWENLVSISQSLEQIIRICIIVISSFLAMKLFDLSLTTTVGFAVFATTVGALISYFYLIYNVKKNKRTLEKETMKIEEPKITDCEIIKKMLVYAFPFVLINIFVVLMNSIDIFVLVKTLVNGIGYTVQKSEAIIGILTTWSQPINIIIIYVTLRLTTSLSYSLIDSFIKKDMEKIKKIVNQMIQRLLFFVVPMTFGLSILVKPIWSLFYGNSQLGTSVCQYHIFVALAASLFTVSIIILQALKEYRKTIICLLVGLLTKILLNIPLLYAFDKMDFPAYYGSITSSILGYAVCGYLALHYIDKKYKINYEDTIKKVLNIFLSTMTMVIILLFLKYIFPFSSSSKFMILLYIMAFTIIGMTIYLTITLKSRIVYDIFEKRNIERILKKLKKYS